MHHKRLTFESGLRLGIFLALLMAGGVLAAWVARPDPAGNEAPLPVAAAILDPAPTIVENLPPAAIPQMPEFVPVSMAVERPGPLAPALSTFPPRVPENTHALADIASYNGQRFRYVKTLRLRVTAYAPDPRCTWPFSGTTTASGLPATTNGGRLVAADTALIPMHSLVRVPGYDNGGAVPVLDRGGAIKGRRLDVMLPTFEKAQAWGVRTIDVKVYAPIQ